MRPGFVCDEDLQQRLEDLRLGTMDFSALMESTNGQISIELTDSGRTRTFSQNYEWEILGSSGQIRIRPTGDGDDRPQVLLPLIHSITWQDIVLFGLYEGDGSKGTFSGVPSDIAFGGAHMSLQYFMQCGLNAWFGNQFDTNWHILDDTLRYFDREQNLLDEHVEEIAALELQMVADGIDLPAEGDTIIRRRAGEPFRFSARHLTVCAEHMSREFQSTARQWDIELPEATTFTPTLSPAKGGYELIQGLRRTSWLMPLWLVIVNTVVDTILENQRQDHERGGWLRWEHNPEDLELVELDIDRFVQERTQIVDRNGTRDFYNHRRVLEDGSVEIGASERHTHTLPATLTLRPFELLMTGFYMAEGGGNKDAIYNIGITTVNYQRELRIQFDQTEGRLFRSAMSLFSSMNIGLPWSIKIGSKYNVELSTICLLYGTLPMCQGTGGEGYGRTIESYDEFQAWALDEFEFFGLPALTALENTGAGLPRPQLKGMSQVAKVFFSCLIRDICFQPETFFNGGEDE